MLKVRNTDYLYVHSRELILDPGYSDICLTGRLTVCLSNVYLYLTSLTRASSMGGQNSDDDHSELDGSAHNSNQDREEKKRGGEGADYRHSHPAFFQLRQLS